MAIEQRKTGRKIVKTKALAAFDGEGTIVGRTVDVGADGVSISFPEPVDAGRSGYVRFDLLIDGKPNQITARAKVQYCIFSQDEFKVGFNFLDLDPAASNALTRLLR